MQSELVTTSLNRSSISYVCHGDRPLVDPFRSHVSRSLFRGLLRFLLLNRLQGNICLHVFQRSFPHSTETFNKILLLTKNVEFCTWKMWNSCYGTDDIDVGNLTLDVLFQLTAFIPSRREEGVRFRRKMKLICSERYKMGPSQSRDAVIIKGSQIHEHFALCLVRPSSSSSLCISDKLKTNFASHTYVSWVVSIDSS
jgi:hypothetical protein